MASDYWESYVPPKLPGGKRTQEGGDLGLTPAQYTEQTGRFGFGPAGGGLADLIRGFAPVVLPFVGGDVAGEVGADYGIGEAAGGMASPEAVAAGAAPASAAGGLSASASGALGVPDPVTGAASPTGSPTPVAPVTAPGTTPAAPGAAAPGAATPAGGGLTGIPQVDSALNWMKQNASWLAPTAVGAAGLMRKPPALPNSEQLSALGAEGAGVAKQLISQYQSGQLQPSQQASLDQLTQQTKNQIRQYFASIHQSDSTAAMQAEAQVDQQALQMKQQMLDQALAQGLNAIGVAQGPLQTIANYQLGQDQALRQAFGTFAGALGTAFGRQAGSTATPTPTGTPSQPTAPVTSVPAPGVGE